MDNSITQEAGFFSNASHVNISSSNFYDVGGNWEHRSLSTGASASGIDALHQYASTNAMHDSGARPKCHPNTRTAIIDEVMVWITDLNRSCNVIWMKGPAGAGKSTIAQTIAERCEDQNLLAASYFFSDNNSESHPNSSQFVTTIAYQLTKYIPDTAGPYIDSVLKQDPAILSAPLEVQWQRLIQQTSRTISKPRPLVIIIDGIDQCDAHDRLPGLITRWISEASNLPFCFLIVSRPNSRIALHRACRHIVLDESYSPDPDIRLFLKDRFAGIYQRHKHAMPSVALPWPTNDTIERLVTDASGLFIYASLVTKFVDGQSDRPSDTLESIVGNLESSLIAFAALDHLYTSILSMCYDQELLLQILGLLLFAGGRERPWTTLFSPDSPSRIDEFLALKPGDTFRTLRELQPLIHLPEGEDDTIIRILHPEFRRFLLNPQRSGKFFIDAGVCHAQITRRCLRAVGQGLTDSVRASRVVEFSCFEWCFRCVQWGNHPDLLGDLSHFDLPRWLDWAVRKSVVLTRSSVAGDPVGQYIKIVDWIHNSGYYSLGQFTLNSLYEAYRRFLQNHCSDDRTVVVRLLGASQIIDNSSRLVNTTTPAKKAWPAILCLLNANPTFEPLTQNIPLCRIHPAGFRQPALRTFLFDLFHSGDFYVDLDAHQENMALGCLSILQQGQGKSEAFCEAVLYARRHWVEHLSSSPASPVLLDHFSNLSSEHHNHHGQAGNILKWLKKFPSVPSALLLHWESSTCISL